MVTGVPFPRIGAEETVRAAIDSPHYKSPMEGPNRGRGVASGFWFNVGLQSSVVVAVNPDGTVNLIEGSTDIGGTRASLAMQLAETLGIRLRRHPRRPSSTPTPSATTTSPAAAAPPSPAAWPPTRLASTSSGR